MSSYSRTNMLKRNTSVYLRYMKPYRHLLDTYYYNHESIVARRHQPWSNSASAPITDVTYRPPKYVFWPWPAIWLRSSQHMSRWQHHNQGLRRYTRKLFNNCNIRISPLMENIHGRSLHTVGTDASVDCEPDVNTSMFPVRVYDLFIAYSMCSIVML